MTISEISWPKLEDLRDLATQRSLTSDELLALKSRSFYAPIALLEYAKGEDEVNKRSEVRTTYNLLRTLDTAEDANPSTLTIADKTWVMGRFLYVVNQVVVREPKENIEDLIEGADLQTVTDKLMDGAFGNDERLFIEHFGKGPVLKELHGFDTQTRRNIDYAVGQMKRGMEKFVERGSMQTEEQLCEYCFYVAGGIGDFLTELVKLKDGVELDDRKARKLGKYLQLTNIIKNIREDWEQGKETRAFIPREYSPYTIGHQYLLVGQGNDAKDARESTLGKMLDLSDRYKEDAVGYVSSIPDELSGYKSFCMIPLVVAMETQKSMKQEGAEMVFQGDPTATKMKGDIRKAVCFVRSITTQTNRTNDWLNDYENDTGRFSFENGHYASWSERYLKQSTSCPKL